MDTSLILFIVAMWILGHAASGKSRDTQPKQCHYRKSTKPLQALTNRTTIHCKKSLSSRTEFADAKTLLRKARHHESVGHVLEARLCRNAASYLLGNLHDQMEMPTGETQHIRGEFGKIGKPSRDFAAA